MGKIIRKKPFISSKGNMIIAPINFTKETVNQVRSFVLDLDIHTQNYSKFDDIFETFIIGEKIEKICEDNKLPVSAIVFTGRGYQLHFKLNNENFYINSELSRKYVEYTFNSFRKFFNSNIMPEINKIDSNFNLDFQTVALAAKVRMPGTVNFHAKKLATTICVNSNIIYTVNELNDLVDGGRKDFISKTNEVIKKEKRNYNKTKKNNNILKVTKNRIKDIISAMQIMGSEVESGFRHNGYYTLIKLYLSIYKNSIPLNSNNIDLLTNKIKADLLKVDGQLTMPFFKSEKEIINTIKYVIKNCIDNENYNFKAKDESLEEYVIAIQYVLEHYPQRLNYFGSYAKEKRERNLLKNINKLKTQTKKEKEELRIEKYIGKGYTIKKISKILGYTEKTINRRILKLINKFNCKDINELKIKLFIKYFNINSFLRKNNLQVSTKNRKEIEKIIQKQNSEFRNKKFYEFKKLFISKLNSIIDELKFKTECLEKLINSNPSLKNKRSLKNIFLDLINSNMNENEISVCFEIALLRDEINKNNQRIYLLQQDKKNLRKQHFSNKKDEFISNELNLVSEKLKVLYLRNESISNTIIELRKQVN